MTPDDMGAEMPDLEHHEIANAFPMLDTDDLNELAADIKESGLRNPVVLFEGKILDGRNRYRACQLAQVEPTFLSFPGDFEAAVKFVTSENLRRRHLTTSQRAMAAEKLATLRQGRQKDDLANAQICAFAQADAARQLGVSRRAVQSARVVTERGVPELAEAVTQGHVAVSAAAELTKLPKDKQREAVAGGKEKVRQAAAEVRQATAEARREPPSGHLRKRGDEGLVLYGIVPAIQSVKRATAKIAEDSNLSLSDKEAIEDAAGQLRSLADWLESIAADGGMTDRRLVEWLSGD